MTLALILIGFALDVGFLLGVLFACLNTPEPRPTYRAADFLKRFSRCPVCRKVHVKVRDGEMFSHKPCDQARIQAVLDRLGKWVPYSKRPVHPERVETLIPDRRHVIPFDGPVS